MDLTKTKATKGVLCMDRITQEAHHRQRMMKYLPESVNHNRQEAQQKPVGYGKMEGVHGKITAPDG
jgi:hypothetical protein